MNSYTVHLSISRRPSTLWSGIYWFKLLKTGVRGSMLDIIKSMYNNVKTRVRHNGCLGEPFMSNIGVRQGECLSPFLFSMYLNDLEAELATKGLPGIDIGTINIYLVMCADDIILFGKTPTNYKEH